MWYEITSGMQCSWNTFSRFNTSPEFIASNKSLATLDRVSFAANGIVPFAFVPYKFHSVIWASSALFGCDNTVVKTEANAFFFSARSLIKVVKRDRFAFRFDLVTGNMFLHKILKIWEHKKQYFENSFTLIRCAILHQQDPSWYSLRIIFHCLMMWDNNRVP